MVDNEGVINLFNAIWEQAIKDDKSNVRKMLMSELENVHGYNKTQAYIMANECDKPIDKLIREEIHTEAQNWPNKDRVSSVRACKRIVNQIIGGL